jgi:hypothetical protein
MAVIYCKGKPTTPPVIDGVTFAQSNEANDIWSATVSAGQVTALAGAGSPFMTQAELDRFAMDLTVLASANSAVTTTTATADGTLTEANSKAELQARLFAAQVRSAIPRVRNGKFNPYL